jgi:hypothetical protein
MLRHRAETIQSEEQAAVASRRAKRRVHRKAKTKSSTINAKVVRLLMNSFMFMMVPF